MKDRFQALVRTNVSLAAIGVALIFGLAACSGSGGASSQGAPGASSGFGGSSAANGRHRMAQVLMGLGLSDAQKSQIRDIMSAARKESANADPATRRANYKAAFAKIDAVLTPDQRAKLHAKLGEMRKDGRQGAPAQS